MNSPKLADQVKLAYRQTSDKIQNEFLTFSTMGSFTVMVGLVTTIWKVAISLNEDWTSNWIPFITAIVLMELYNIFTFDWSTYKDLKMLFWQTVFIALLNGVLIYATCIGIESIADLVNPDV